MYLHFRVSSKGSGVSDTADCAHGSRAECTSDLGEALPHHRSPGLVRPLFLAHSRYLTKANHPNQPRPTATTLLSSDLLSLDKGQRVNNTTTGKSTLRRT